MFDDIMVQVLNNIDDETIVGLAHNQDMVMNAFYISLSMPFLLAINIIYKILKISPENGDLHFALYKLLISHSKKFAYFHLEKAIEFAPDKYSFMCFFLAGEYYKTGENNMAVKYFLKAIEYNYKDQDSYAMLGEIYRQQGKVNTAVKILKKGLNVYPDCRLYKIIMGTTLMNSAYIRQAIECFDSVSKEQSEYRELALFKSGLAYMMAGKYDEAGKKWETLLSLYPDSLRGNYSMGFLCEVSNNFEDGIKYFQKCLTIVPEHLKHIIKSKLKELRLNV